jgi:hypothetical protein
VVILREDKIPPHEKEMDELLDTMTSKQRDDILLLKAKLIDEHRYGGLPKHPYIFTGTDVYKAVIDGKAKTLRQLEGYWRG